MAKKANNKGALLVPMHKYCKSRLGKSQVKGTSIYEVCEKALAEDGLTNTAGLSTKAFVLSCSAFIIRTAKSVVLTPVATNPAVKEKKARKPVQQSYLEYKAESDKFLASYDWKRLRMEALKLHGAKCQCCGASPSTGAVLNVDHVLPRKTHPHLSLELSNLQVLCGDCNHGKGNWDTTDWRVLDSTQSVG